MSEKFSNVSIILPAVNETFSFKETVKTILDECQHEDLCEMIAVVCDKTSEECLISIHESKKYAEEKGVSFKVLWQNLPFAGGAVRDAIDVVQGTHLIMMSTDLETDPSVVKTLIESAKDYPDDITTASRWINTEGNFEGYDTKKLILNYIFQKIFSIFYGANLTDMTYAFRIFPSALMKSIRWEELRHPFYFETALKPVRLGVKFHEVPAKWRAREEGESQNTFWQTFAYVKTGVRMRFYSRDDILKHG